MENGFDKHKVNTAQLIWLEGKPYLDHSFCNVCVQVEASKKQTFP